MSGYQFWQIVIQAVAAAGTLLIAVLAILGDMPRRWLFGPKLIVTLHDPDGEQIDAMDSVTGIATPSRYYHLRVENKRKSAIASNVHVLLTKITRESDEGTTSSTNISGAIQMQWQRRPPQPEYRTVGPKEAIADLGVIREGEPAFGLAAIIHPHNLDLAVRQGERVTVEFVAVADETKSKPTCIEIAWPKEYGAEDLEKSSPIRVREAACP